MVLLLYFNSLCIFEEKCFRIIFEKHVVVVFQKESYGVFESIGKYLKLENLTNKIQRLQSLIKIHIVALSHIRVMFYEGALS